jgi:MFS family permease
VGILFAIIFVDLVGFGLVIPLLPFYAEQQGASPQLVTLVMASYSAAQLFAAPLWGRISDRHGRRPVLLVSLVGSVASYIWLGAASALWMLFAARLLAGACAGNIAAAQAYIADVTTPENRAKGMGMVGAAFGLGFIVGPALGGVLAGADPAHPGAAPAFLGAGLSFLAFLGTLLFLKESLPPERRGKARRIGRIAALTEAFGRPTLRLLIAIYFAVIFAFSAMETTFAMWASRQLGWGALQVGALLAYVGLISAAMQGGLIGRLTRLFGEVRLLLAGATAIILGLVLLPLAYGLLLLLPAMALLALGMGMTQPSINSLVSRRAGGHEQGQVMGVTQSVGSFARIVGPALAGVVFAVFGRQAPFFFGAAVMALAALLAARLDRPAPAAAFAPKTEP